MEKLDEESATKFINALIKSVQTLCHGYLDFHNGIEIIGHINLNVDKGSSLHYILEEKVCKNEENSTLFISNSFHAQNHKPDAKAKGKDSQAAQVGNQVVQRTNSTDTGEVGRVSSAISSISSALSRSHEKSHSGSTSSTKDLDTSHSIPVSSTAKRKSSDDVNNDVRTAKSSRMSSSPSPVSHFLSQSPHGPSGSSSPVDTKPTLSELRGEESMGTVLPQTAAVSGDSVGDLGVNLAGSVLERVDDHSNSDLPDRGDDSDGDLEVTFIKEEYVEGEQSACQFQNSGGQQYGRGTHQRASSSDNLPDASLYPVSLHHSASATFVPSAHDMATAQHYGPSTSSQPQPGTSGVRGVFTWPRGFGIVHTARNAAPAGHSSFLTRKHTCQICGYSSIYQNNFKRHMRIHTGQLFRCHLCDVQFNCRYYLQKHVRKKHGSLDMTVVAREVGSRENETERDGHGRGSELGQGSVACGSEGDGRGQGSELGEGSFTSPETESSSRTPRACAQGASLAGVPMNYTLPKEGGDVEDLRDVLM